MENNKYKKQFAGLVSTDYCNFYKTGEKIVLNKWLGMSEIQWKNSKETVIRTCAVNKLLVLN